MNHTELKQVKNLREGSHVVEDLSSRLHQRQQRQDSPSTQTRRATRRPLEVTPPTTTTTREKLERHEPQPIFTTTTFFLCGSLVILLANLSTPIALVVVWCAARWQRYLFRINDSSSIRRQLLKDFLRKDTLTAPLRKLPRDVQVKEHYWVNRRGMSLMTSIITPNDGQPIQSVVCYCHGYTDFPTLTRAKEFCRLAKKGIAVVMIEYEGHGRSDGALGLITDWDKLVDDVYEFFEETVSKRFPNVPTFLMGESMGGAVSYCIYKRNPKLFRGVVLVCPMCKIGEDFLPPQWVIDISRQLAGPKGSTTNMGYLPIAPSEGLNIDFAIRPHKQKMLSAFPLEYGRKPRLATAREMLDVTIHISKDLQNFHAPMLIQHGSLDRLTDPKLSEALYNESKSTDKTLKIYDGMLHSLLSGEFDKNIDVVLGDSIEWILERSHAKTQ